MLVLKAGKNASVQTPLLDLHNHKQTGEWFAVYVNDWPSGKIKYSKDQPGAHDDMETVYCVWGTGKVIKLYDRNRWTTREEDGTVVFFDGRYYAAKGDATLVDLETAEPRKVSKHAWRKLKAPVPPTVRKTTPWVPGLVFLTETTVACTGESYFAPNTTPTDYLTSVDHTAHQYLRHSSPVEMPEFYWRMMVFADVVEVSETPKGKLKTLTLGPPTLIYDQSSFVQKEDDEEYVED